MLKKKINIVIAMITLVLAGFVVNSTLADSNAVDFELYTLGSVNGQDGWSATGPTYDQEVEANTFGYVTFGTKTFRMSNAVTSGSFGDWVFSKPLVDEVGESASTNGGMSGGVRQRHFEASFDFASAVPGSHQTGLQISISPDRGDGSRQSFIRLEDTIGGIDAIFVDVQGTFNPANFVSSTIASDLDRTVPHNLRFEIDFVDGPSNDVVEIFIDGVSVHTGTTWENYYRFDSEAIAEQSPRTIDSLIFQARSGAGTAPATLGAGFLFDNLSLLSSVPLTPAPTPTPSVTPTPEPFAVPAECSAITGLGAPIVGTASSDNINGTGGNDLIFALGGSDRVNGKGGNDCIVGGDGSDRLTGAGGLDVILGGDGSDSIDGGGQDDSLFGQGASDSIRGGGGNDMLSGGDGSDSLKGEGGADTLDGGLGSDSANGGGGTDTCSAEAETSCEI